MEEVHKKKKNYTMRFTDIYVNFDVTYEGYQNVPGWCERVHYFSEVFNFCIISNVFGIYFPH